MTDDATGNPDDLTKALSIGYPTDTPPPEVESLDVTGIVLDGVAYDVMATSEGGQMTLRNPENGRTRTWCSKTGLWLEDGGGQMLDEWYNCFRADVLTQDPGDSKGIPTLAQAIVLPNGVRVTVMWTVTTNCGDDPGVKW